VERQPAGAAVQFSRYLRTRERGEWTAVFHELYPEPWYVPTATWRSVQASVDLPPLLVAELRQRGLLISSAAQDGQSFAYAETELARRLDRAACYTSCWFKAATSPARTAPSPSSPERQAMPR